MWTDWITCRACSLAAPPAPLSLSHTPSLPCSACSYHSLTPRLLCTLACFALLSFPSLCLSLYIPCTLRMEEEWGCCSLSSLHPFSFSLPFFLSLTFDWFPLSLLFSINPHSFPRLRFPLCQSSSNITSHSCFVIFPMMMMWSSMVCVFFFKGRGCHYSNVYDCQQNLIERPKPSMS